MASRLFSGEMLDGTAPVPPGARLAERETPNAERRTLNVERRMGKREWTNEENKLEALTRSRDVESSPHEQR